MVKLYTLLENNFVITNNLTAYFIKTTLLLYLFKKKYIHLMFNNVRYITINSKNKQVCRF